MFGAKWRWKVLERSVPRLVGPETYEGPPPGFLGLSYRNHLRFLLIVVVMMVINLLSVLIRS